MDITRAWKDPVYRASLSEQELRALPDNPAGAVELTDSDLSELNGGTTTLPCVTLVTWEAGCFSWNDTFCNGTCALATQGCCG
jgi:mersacidin/lichenicidin family type 2 lantibiotic